MKKELKEKIEIKDLGIWLKISVIGWLVYLGMVALSLIINTFYLLSGKASQ